LTATYSSLSRDTFITLATLTVYMKGR
jgi:hypothetical protein